MKADLNQVRAFLIDLIFPNRCPFCGKVINWRLDYCQSCFDELRYVGDEFCRRCGNSKAECLCGRDNEKLYSFCYPAFYYETSAKGGVIYLKNEKNRIFPNIAMDKAAADMQKDNIKADCIVPVPMARLKLRKRGFNQAEVLAEALSERLDIPVYNDLIVKSESVIAQHKLTANMRKINADSLYSLGKGGNIITDKTVIVVDDVMTTGSTINSCARILLELGAASVIAVAAAKTE